MEQTEEQQRLELIALIIRLLIFLLILIFLFMSGQLTAESIAGLLAGAALPTRWLLTK